MNQAEHDLLVIEAQDGSVAALDRLVRLHHRPLTRFALDLCGDPELARDAVQETWIRIAATLRRLDDPRAFRGWVYRALRWRVVDQLRRVRRGGESLESAPEPSDQGRQASRRDARMDLSAAIDRLSSIDRQTLMLYYVQGLTGAEIALVLDIAPGTVKSRLHRARNQLKFALEGERNETR